MHHNVSNGPALPWIERAKGVPYFQTDSGQAWHPIGQNDALTWHDFDGLYHRCDVPRVEGHLRWLAAHGVTCVRMMLEYAQESDRYFETGFTPAGLGQRAPAMVQFWDDLFALCESTGIRVLLTPYDTFWMWRKWEPHPYNESLGGVLRSPTEALLCKRMRAAVKDRLTFAAERWGGSGALFAWDLWNEIHPAHANDEAAPFAEFIDDLSRHVRDVETRKWGRSHLQTVSLYGPELSWKPHLREMMEESIFRHPALDFATIHGYRPGTIDDPENTVDAAVDMGEIVRECVGQITDARPFLDTEHGPIHRFDTSRCTLPEDFDDEYFRHMQWAHLASGGAGGGMRWPYRHPHALTHGMRRAQAAMAAFLPCVDWLRFDRRNVSQQMVVRGTCCNVGTETVARFGCASGDQAVLYLLRCEARVEGNVLRRDGEALPLNVCVPGLRPGRYTVTCWDTVAGTALAQSQQTLSDDHRIELSPLQADMAVVIKRSADL